MRRVVVTGGLGFIGSRLARRLAADGHDVRVLDARLPGSGAHDANLDGVRCDVREVDLAAADLAPLLEGASAVYHLAGATGHADSMQDPVRDLRHNLHATLALLQAVRAACPQATVVFTSTRQVYGRARSLPVAESHPVAPPDINAVHKLACEQALALYGQVHGVRGTSLRLTNVYGPGLRIADGRQMFLGVWLRRLLEGQPFEVWGGQQRRDLLHVDDAVEALLAAARAPAAAGRTFNVGHRDAVSLRELADLLVQANGGGHYTVKPMPAERAAIEVGDYATDASALRAATGWVPQVALADGLRSTLEHYRPRWKAYVEAAA